MIFIASNWHLMITVTATWFLLFSGGTFAAEDKNDDMMKRRKNYLLHKIYKEYTSPSAEDRDSTRLSMMDGVVWKSDRKRELLVEVIATSAGAEQVLQSAFEISGFQTTGCLTYHCSGFLPMDSFLDLEAQPEVMAIRPSIPSTNQAGSVVSEAVESLYVNLVRASYPSLTGAGFRIGIISVSFNTNENATTNWNDDIQSGDLPGPDRLKVLNGDYKGDDRNDEGRAIAQLIHDIAPDAELFVVSGYEGSSTFVMAIKELADCECDVIVDDLTYFSEPFFQDGNIAQEANKVARDQGIPYFSSAGNYGSASWEGPFVSSTESDPSGCVYHDFGEGDIYQGITTLSNDTQIFLQWEDRFQSVNGPPGASRDLNLIVTQLDGSNRKVVDQDLDIDIGVDPYAVVFLPAAGSFEISITLCYGTAPSLMKWIANSTYVTIEGNVSSSTVIAQQNAEYTAGVGAAFFQNTPAFDVSPPKREDFTSRGGTQILFEADGTRKPASEVREQPRFVATDGCINTFFGDELDFKPNGQGFYFFGTSAAAPNAAAVAILMLQANPTLTPLQVYSILQKTAIDMNTNGFDFDTGYGYIDANAAVRTALNFAVVIKHQRYRRPNLRRRHKRQHKTKSSKHSKTESTKRSKGKGKRHNSYPSKGRKGWSS